jgi:hypothetical protein
MRNNKQQYTTHNNSSEEKLSGRFFFHHFFTSLLAPPAPRVVFLLPLLRGRIKKRARERTENYFSSLFSVPFGLKLIFTVHSRGV